MTKQRTFSADGTATTKQLRQQQLRAAVASSRSTDSVSSSIRQSDLQRITRPTTAIDPIVNGPIYNEPEAVRTRAENSLQMEAEERRQENFQKEPRPTMILNADISGSGGFGSGNKQTDLLNEELPPQSIPETILPTDMDPRQKTWTLLGVSWKPLYWVLTGFGMTLLLAVAIKYLFKQ